MPNLSIKGVPEELAARLRSRAERNHRSLQGEMMFILTQALGEPALDGADTSAGAATTPSVSSMPQSGAGIVVGTRTIEQIAADIRNRVPRHASAALPRAVDILRSERDAR